MIDEALVEVDGLFAGLIYLDATDPPLPQRTSKNCFRNSLAVKLDVICNACEIRPETNTSNAPSSTIHESILAREAAWSSIRTVRDGMQILWDHFVDISRVLNTSTIDSLRNSYHDAQGLCYEGVFAFRDTVVGQKPDDLVAIFAFCSWSYVITRLFCARKRAKQSDIPAGIRSWRDAIKEEDERQAFDALAAQMWPEAQNHVHFQYPDPGQPLARSTSTHGHSGSASPVSSSHYKSSMPPFPADFSNMPPFGCDQQAHQPSNKGSMGHSFDPLQDTCLGIEQVNNDTTNTSTAFSQNPQSFTDPINGACHFPVSNAQLSVPNNELYADSRAWSDLCSVPSLNVNIMEPLVFTALGDPTSQSADYTNLITDPTQGLSDRGLLETTAHVSALQMTSTFMVVREYIRDNCNFWHRLAGSGLVSKDHKSCRLWWRKTPARMECKQTSSYIQQLLAVEHTRNIESRGIVAVAEPLIKWGFLQSIEDIKLYMTQLGGLLFDAETDRQGFCKWIEGFSGDNKKPFICPYCSHRNNHEGNLRRHIKNRHGNVENGKAKQ
ncbi:hypothetical protein FOQG_10924 [Fusarium oxysporum f. sp. raphani 54005]|uniref:C2H2-type domain-containing protein n=4 Tax=Fusarium oxysporum TaxID=5507 RepID=X0CR26_FUSOX|nr:hypothetical protein FOXB_10453 [Fusarium oxysporum f. sp. conglutinans Fo5176]EXK84962.1 hypothetical protein FOQG_10924 [Fusarium oxysporum f. sp. raphani 54005]EXL71645.1 hypothetical protein FOPG_12613 [Fusarium oxysporum f. sp. conglutinans race 2 54008]KAG6987745.1 hypothetical protein FocnCong_v003586 [Fusarium oxysporum f. sp. conglutinans]KAG7433029.1 hypothetical protein Forpi1262_v005628 [Fusarium oxysporum f. sp. raphani]KAJ4045904.1 hypothetical protein NW758_006096 [Fusarium o